MAEAARDLDLTLNPDKAFYILLKARQFDEKSELSDPDSGSNPSDDLEVDVLEDSPDDPVFEELTAAIEGLNDDEQLDLIALTWIGRGDFSLDQWSEAREAAKDITRERTPRYLTQIPLLSDHLQEGLSQLGWRMEDYVLEL
jgi:hypothetical protein